MRKGCWEEISENKYCPNKNTEAYFDGWFSPILCKFHAKKYGFSNG